MMIEIEDSKVERMSDYAEKNAQVWRQAHAVH